MFSFAGTALADSTNSDVGIWIEQNITPSQIYPLAYRTWPGSLVQQPILNNTAENQCPVEINTFMWPVGASRFARANFVVSTAMLESIRGTIYTAGAEAAADLVFSDGVNSRTAEMWMLPALPLNNTSTQGLYLLTLVDERYYWWGTPLSLSIDVGVTSWADLYTACGTALGETITPDTIDADYGTPPQDYDTLVRPLPPVLDAIAWSVGQRLIRDYDGTLTTQNASTALTAVAANQLQILVPYAGGTLDFTP